MVIPPGYARVFIQYEIIGGHDCQNVIDYAVDSAPDQSDVDALSALYATPYKAQLNSGSLYQGIKVLVGNDGDPSVLFSTSGAGVGGRGVALAAPQCMGLISKKTALAGRRNRGRIFIPNMAETNVGDLGTIDSGGLTLLNNIAAALYITGTPWTNPVILHSDNSTPTPVTTLVAETQVATLRRRYER